MGVHQNYTSVRGCSPHPLLPLFRLALPCKSPGQGRSIFAGPTLRHRVDGHHQQAREQAVVLFDGVCNLCNGTVRFIVDRDPTGYFKFASLQSHVGVALSGVDEVENVNWGTVVLIETGRRFTRSTAVLRIMRRLSGPWPLLASLLIIPRPVRDLGYALVAKYRYRWFGRNEVCRLPRPDERARFLDASSYEA